MGIDLWQNLKMVETTGCEIWTTNTWDYTMVFLRDRAEKKNRGFLIDKQVALSIQN